MGERFHASLPRGRRSGGLRRRSRILWSCQESAPDVVGSVPVQRFVRPVEPELAHRRCEDEVHFQALLDACPSMLEIDGAGVIEYACHFCGASGSPVMLPPPLKYTQLAVTHDLQCLEGHHPVAAAKRLCRSHHQLAFWRSRLSGQHRHQRVEAAIASPRALRCSSAPPSPCRARCATAQRRIAVPDHGELREPMAFGDNRYRVQPYTPGALLMPRWPTHDV